VNYRELSAPRHWRGHQKGVGAKQPIPLPARCAENMIANCIATAMKPRGVNQGLVLIQIVAARLSCSNTHPRRCGSNKALRLGIYHAPTASMRRNLAELLSLATSRNRGTSLGLIPEAATYYAFVAPMSWTNRRGSSKHEESLTGYRWSKL
jgi:hypothetical protein